MTDVKHLKEKLVEPGKSSDEYFSVDNEWVELEQSSKTVSLQEFPPRSQVYSRNVDKKYKTLKEHSDVLIDKLQREVKKKTEQAMNLEIQRQTLEREKQDLQKRLDEKCLGLCQTFKQQRSQKDCSGIDKEFELMKSATMLTKPEIVAPVRDCSRQPTNTTSGVEAANGVKITLMKGDIVQQKADVKVVGTNSISSLGTGAFRALINAGGNDLEDECKRRFSERNRTDVVTVVNGIRKLECHQLYLAHLPSWNGDISHIYKATESSLLSAQQYASILFNAMGTGVLNYPRDKVAMEMYQAVIDFAEKHEGTTLKDIRFVVFDTKTESAFKTEETRRKKPDKPAFVCDIGQIKFQIVIGDIMEQQADVIVCEVDSNFNGGMAQTLKKKCPDAARTVQRSLSILRKKEEGLIFTKNSGLFTRMLICVTFEGVPHKWRRLVTCLERADEEGYCTVSCSLNLRPEHARCTFFDVEETISALFSAAEVFFQKYRKPTVKLINFVLPECQLAILPAVIESLQCLILRIEKRKLKDNRQIFGFLLSPDVP